jgi:hypothetical protein
MRPVRPLIPLVVAATALAAAVPAATAAGATPSAGTAQNLTGALADGATYQIEVPAAWNGTLLLYSHGYVTPGSPNPAQDAGDPVTHDWALANGFALAGSSYATTGYAIAQALPDQIATLDLFDKTVGKPRTTIAWGHSLGGITTAGLVQNYPGRFDGALPMCGVLAGSVATWNQALDGAFAFQTLVDPAVSVVHVTDPQGNLKAAETGLATAQQTPQGRARLALSAALGDTPGWFDPFSPEPAATDYAAQEANQYTWSSQVDFPFAFALRAELEARSGGNPSWNTGVDYTDQLRKSTSNAEVRALYAAAGLDLKADLAKLNSTARVSADPAAVSYLTANITFNGDLDIPVLSMHTTGDGLVTVQNEQAYQDVVADGHDSSLLRQVYVHRAGHCSFTPAETVTALEALLSRLATGHWDGRQDPALMNSEAAAMGPGLNIFAVGSTVAATAPAFIPYDPAKYLRPFDLGRN